MANPNWTKGISGNPNGRPKKSVEEKYRTILVSKVSSEDWARIVAVAIQQAQDGDDRARKWLSDNLIGLPVQRQEVAATVETKDLSQLSDDELRRIAEGKRTT
jgi:plasmid stability protein